MSDNNVVVSISEDINTNSTNDSITIDSNDNTISSTNSEDCNSEKGILILCKIY